MNCTSFSILFTVFFLCIEKSLTLYLHCKSFFLKNLKCTWSCIRLEWLTLHFDNWLWKASLINGFSSTVDYRYCGHPRGDGGKGGRRFSVLKRESEMAGYVSNVASRTRKRSSCKQEILKFAPNWKMGSLFSFIVMSLYIMWVRILDKARFS